MNFVAKICLPVRISTLDVAKTGPNNPMGRRVGDVIGRWNGSILIDSLMASVWRKSLMGLPPYLCTMQVSFEGEEDRPSQTAQKVWMLRQRQLADK